MISINAAPAVAGQLRVNLRLQQVLNALHERGIVGHFAHLGVWRFQRQLGAQLVGNKIVRRLPGTAR